MHQTQSSILQLFKGEKSLPLKLRWIGREIGEEHPQKIKFHLEALEKAGMIRIDRIKKEIYRWGLEENVDHGEEEPSLISLPIMWLANCWTPTAFADNTIEWYLKVSRWLLPTRDTSSLFILKAKGDSMNKANIDGSNIEDGDFVVVREKHSMPDPGEKYVVSLIDDCANIKRFFYEKWQITLVSESTKEYNPMFIHENDRHSYHVMGIVIKVIKTPKF